MNVDATRKKDNFIASHYPQLRDYALFHSSVVIQKSLSFICHSKLDLACPVLDTGESSVFGLDSRWSLPRT